MVSGAAGVYVGVLVRDPSIDIDLVIEPEQHVSVIGNASLPRPPRWGGGSFTVQQRGLLSLSSMEMPSVHVGAGGKLTLARMIVPVEALARLLTRPAPSIVLKLSETVLAIPTADLTAERTQWPQLQPGTLVVSTDANGTLTHDPPVFSYMDWFHPVRPVLASAWPFRPSSPSAQLRLLCDKLSHPMGSTIATR